MEGDERVKVASFVGERFVCDKKKDGKGEKGKVPPHTEEGGDGKPEHAQKLEGIAQLMVLLREARNGDKRDIKDDIGREPADGDGKLAEDQTADDGQDHT